MTSKCAVQPEAHVVEKTLSTEKHAVRDSYECLVRESPQGSIYCHRWWLDAVAPGQYQILRITHGAHLVAAWPIVFQGQREHRKCTMPPLTQKLGILFAPASAKYAEELSKQHELIEQFIRQLPSEINFFHQFHENFTNWLPFYWHGFTQTTRYTYVLPDLSDEEALWSGMRAPCRGWIRKAKKNGIDVDDDLPLDRFVELHDRTYSRQGMKTPVAEELIDRVDAACCEHAGRKMFAGVDGAGRIHAAVWLAWDNGTAYFLMTGSDPELRRSGALKLVVYEAVRFAGTVAKRFDFEGSMIRPVESAFRDFGARQMPYFAIRKDVSMPPTLRQFARYTARTLKGWTEQRLRSMARRQGRTV